ncbi:MAG: hypothetical protein ACOX7J_03185 [Bacillota bacterium]|jgi:hypothetical protein
MNMLFLAVICLFLALPAVFCIFSGGFVSVVGILALIVWGYLLWLVLDEYRRCKNGWEDEENP